jgi:NADPH:quinone reductase-like Zn-dependent oxidoreductase
MFTHGMAGPSGKSKHEKRNEGINHWRLRRCRKLWCTNCQSAWGEVTAVCSQKNAAMVTDLGATKVIDYHQQDFLKSESRYDIIFDTIGRHDLSKCSPIMNPGGTYVSTVPSPKNLKSMVITKIQSFFFKSCKKATVVMVKSEGSDLDEVAKLISAGSVKPVIDHVFPLQQASLAHDHSRSLSAKGKIILVIQ